ncbi:hypothetical protein HYFRA_00006563 [Hymenoscyphus fraxineus]|uniref:Uncharacterized protein n=1 Tax=Hymenoscyphus fraxineus TaxID=746836 RepID=A0A9N9PHY1_9HELO|nr:hypothetical protein HYFRA_00006563 [Hymenoscyphus fraxineus]
MRQSILILGLFTQYQRASGAVIGHSNNPSLSQPKLQRRQSAAAATVTQTPLARTVVFSSTRFSSTTVTKSVSSSIPQGVSIAQSATNDPAAHIPTTTIPHLTFNTPINDINQTTITTLSLRSTQQDSSKNNSHFGTRQKQILAAIIGGFIAWVIFIYLLVSKRNFVAVLFHKVSLKMPNLCMKIKSKSGGNRSSGWWSKLPLPRFGAEELPASRQYMTVELPASDVQPVYELPAGSIHQGTEHNRAPHSDNFQSNSGFLEEPLAEEPKSSKGNSNTQMQEALFHLGELDCNHKMENLEAMESPTSEESPMLKSQSQEPNDSSTRRTTGVNAVQLLPPTSTKPKRRETLPPPPLPTRPTKRTKVPEVDFRLISPKGSTTLLTLDLPTSPISLSHCLDLFPAGVPKATIAPERTPPIVPPRPVKVRKKESVSDEKTILPEVTAIPPPPSPMEDKVKPELPSRPSSSPDPEFPGVSDTTRPTFSSNFSFSSPTFATLSDYDIPSQKGRSIPPPSPISPTAITNKDSIAITTANVGAEIPKFTAPPSHIPTPPPPQSSPEQSTASSKGYRRNKTILMEAEITNITPAIQVPHASPPLSPKQLNKFVPLVTFTPPAPHQQHLDQDLPSVSMSQSNKSTYLPPLHSQVPANTNEASNVTPRASSQLGHRELAELAGAFAPTHAGLIGDDTSGEMVRTWVYR